MVHILYTHRSLFPVHIITFNSYDYIDNISDRRQTRSRGQRKIPLHKTQRNKDVSLYLCIGIKIYGLYKYYYKTLSHSSYILSRYITKTLKNLFNYTMSEYN